MVINSIDSKDIFILLTSKVIDGVELSEEQVAFKPS